VLLSACSTRLVSERRAPQFAPAPHTAVLDPVQIGSPIYLPLMVLAGDAAYQVLPVAVPVSAETLAALTLRAAQRAGWEVKPLASKKSELWWMVWLYSPTERDLLGDPRLLYVPVWQDSDSGPALLHLGDGQGALPAELLEPLQDEVRAYLSHTSPRVRVLQ
jgi:hypothetical protein